MNNFNINFEMNNNDKDYKIFFEYLSGIGAKKIFTTMWAISTKMTMDQLRYDISKHFEYGNDKFYVTVAN